ncbi:hypothetical protein M9458_023054, partial [Cirrhinus mrigala]
DPANQLLMDSSWSLATANQRTATQERRGRKSVNQRPDENHSVLGFHKYHFLFFKGSSE